MTNPETTHMRQAIGYIIARDIFLLLLITGHVLFYYQWIIGPSVLWVLAVGAVAWAIIYVKSVKMYLKIRRDRYLRDAYYDEYFKNIMLKSGYRGYVAVFILCFALIVVSAVSDLVSIHINLPYQIVCEFIIMVGLFTDDVSKIIELSR